VVIGSIADGVSRGFETLGANAREAFFEPVIRLGVTGPSRAGKTVFITALVHNLMNRARMGGLVAEAEGRIAAAFLQPQPDVLVPRFAYEDHLACLSGPDPKWPEGTRAISELRLSFRLTPGGIMGAVTGPRRVHLDIVDYPGEWLLDLALLDMDYGDWSDEVLGTLNSRSTAQEFMALAHQVPANGPHDEVQARALTQAYTDSLIKARADGYRDATPGRFLLPGDLADSPALTFAPLPGAGGAARGSLGREMARRFTAYKTKVVRPFFRDHFARIDRQVVLIDPLGALAAGPRALADLQAAMAATLEAFRPGRNGALARLLRGRRVEKILFAATKADSLHHTQHAGLTALTQAMLRAAADRAEFAGAEVAGMAIAALRTTSEETRDGMDMVLGRSGKTGQAVAFHPGDLPGAPGDLLAAARARADEWPAGGFEAPDFRPRPLTLEPGQGLPHLRLDRAAQFLIGDRL
jgi:predicted YcjX-like family ATPase